MQSPSFTRYRVDGRERRTRAFLWALIAAACVVIVVFLYLILSGGLA